MNLSIKVGWLSILILLSTVGVYGQNRIADSLHTLARKETDPPKRVDLLTQIAYELYNYNDSMALEFAQQALQEASAIDYSRGIKYAYALIGLGYVSKSEYPLAFSYYRTAAAVKAENGAEIDTDIFSMVGNAHRDLSSFDSAYHYYDRALASAKTTENPRSLAIVYKNRGYLKVLMFQNIEGIEDLLKAEDLIKERNEVYQLAEIWGNLGKAYSNLLSYDRAREYYSKMCDLVEGRSDLLLLIKCHLSRADLALRMGDLSLSLEESFKAFELSGTYSYPPQQVEVYTRIGDVYLDLSQHELAAKYFFEALKIAEKYGLRQRTALLYSSLAWVYKELANYELALEYVDRAQRIREEINDQHGMANCHNVRGLIFLLQKKNDEALTELEKSKTIRESIGHLEGIASSMFNISLVYEQQGLLEKAVSIQKSVIEIEEKIGNKQNLAISYNGIAGLLIKLGRFAEAAAFLKKGGSLAVQTKSRLLIRNNYQLYSELYLARKDYKNAVQYQKLYQQLNDSIYTTSSRTKMAEMQAMYQIEQKEQQIKLLSQEKQLREHKIALQDSQINTQKILIASSVLGIVLLSVLAWNIYKSKKDIQTAHWEITEQNEEIQAQTEELTEANGALTKLNTELSEQREMIQSQSEELMEANQTISEINKSLEWKIEKRTKELKQAYKELDTFFYRSSHDFRRPLTTFLGLAEVAKITVKDKNALELFEKVKETATNLDKMLVKLQSISDVGTHQLFFKEVMIQEIFDSVCDNFRDELKKKEIVTEYEVNLRSPFSSYPALVKVIIENLVENSIQFPALVNPRISLRVNDSAEAVVMELEDNGHGIDPEYQQRIFDMYFRASHFSKGNGLGLYIVKKAVEKLNGEISFTSQIDAGTTFKVVLPRNTKLAAVTA